jgi:hypothetical protein
MTIWDHIIKVVDSTFDDLTYMMEYGVKLIPYFSTNFSNGHNYYLLSVEEEMLLTYNHRDVIRFNQSVKWTEEQLSNWKDCRKVSNNLWWFNNIDDVEKFKVLFLLKWV